MIYHRSPSGILKHAIPVAHRNHEHREACFNTLLSMQEDHFWYFGGHQFLLKWFDRYTPKTLPRFGQMILRGRVGEGMRYLADRHDEHSQKIALSNISLVVHTMVRKILPQRVDRYQIDLVYRGRENERDIALMLDVIEYIPDDIRAGCLTAKVLKPDGLLFVTKRAFHQFKSYNDDFPNHLRSNTRSNFKAIADQTGIKLLDPHHLMPV